MKKLVRRALRRWIKSPSREMEAAGRKLAADLRELFKGVG